MGLPTPTQQFLHSTLRVEAWITSSPIALPSVAGWGGGFDTPQEKCPPDRGSSVRVTGKPASYFPSYPLRGTAENSYSRTPSTQRTALADSRVFPIATPPLSPSDDASSASSSLTSLRSFDLDAAPEFLASLFPRAALRASPYSKGVSVSGGGATFDGFVLELPKGMQSVNPRASIARTLYVDGRGAENAQLRECVVAMLDLADEQLGCQLFVIALEKSSPALGSLLHSLMYVGGAVVTQAPFEVSSGYVLVGIEV